MPDKYPPFTIAETKEWIELCINKKNGYDQKAIETLEGKHIGWVDLKNFDYSNHHAEIGITIGDKNYWGKGYGQAAMYAMLHYGFTIKNLNKIWLRVDMDNEKAIRSYKISGFVEEGVLRADRYKNGQYIDRLRMSILKREFIAD